jgi:hypothetical protein
MVQADNCRLSFEKHIFKERSVHVGFMVDKEAMGQGFLSTSALIMLFHQCCICIQSFAIYSTLSYYLSIT